MTVPTTSRRTSGTLNALSGSGVATASSASIADMHGLLGERAADQGGLGGAGPPRLRRDGTERQPDVGDAVAVHDHRRRERGEAERERRPLADLAVGDASALDRRRDLDGLDQPARLEDRVAIGRVAGQPEEVVDRDGAAVVASAHHHRRVHRSEGHGHVRRVVGDARVGSTEDRQVAVVAVAARAARPRRTLVARLRGVLEVTAPRALEQVPGDRGHVAHLPRRTRQQRHRQQGVTPPHRRVAGHVAVAGRATDAQAAVVELVDGVEAESGDVDEHRRTGRAELHEVDEVRAARQVRGALRRRHEVDGLGGIRGSGVGEGSHRTVASATRSTAGTMFT